MVPFSVVKNLDVPFFQRADLRARSCQIILAEAATLVIHRLSLDIFNFSMHMLGCKVALEQDLSIRAIFRHINYSYVPLILSTGPNGI